VSNLSPLEARTKNFYDWELQGRGWRTYPYPVALEPPFRPFPGHSVSGAPVDDGRKHTVLSRFARWIAGAEKAVSSPVAKDLELRKPPCFKRTAPLGEWEVLVPAAEKIEPAAAADWLRIVTSSRGPVSFELVGHEGRVSIRIVVEERDSEWIRDHTRAFFPAVSLCETRPTLDTVWFRAQGEIIGAVEFGLAREFMLPLNDQSVRTNFLTPVVAALGALGSGEIGIFQVLFEPVRAPWSAHTLKAVTTPLGEPFFADAPEITELAREKCADPLCASVIRVAVSAITRETAEDVLVGVATALSLRGSTGRNEFTPLPPGPIDELVNDILERTTHRSGMILSLSDLAGIVHLPAASLVSERLVRPATHTKAAPPTSATAPFVLGKNQHQGEEHTVGLTTEDRLRHCYIIGASGAGKSTLLLSMACQDIEAGNGFAVLDPHGDLIEDILSRIPQERAGDVVIFDPADDDFPVGFNILSAHSELERQLLSSDLVAVFRRLSTSFGDQMVAVLGNAILAFLESSEGGTLLDLRRFLLDKDFRVQFLKTVRDPEIISYWRHEFPLLKGAPHAPILTRLNTFLRPRLIRYMVAQKTDRLDMRAIMDGRKILLAKLSQGAIGEENSHLLGSLLVAKIAQSAMSRQNEPQHRRVPFFLYIDEFHHFVTPSVAAILAGARKYALGLTLAHQDMRQIKSRSEDVASAVLANASTRIVFRVSDQDARALADGFSFFGASDLQNLRVGEAITRIERPTYDFNLNTVPPTRVDNGLASARREAVVAASRSRYATPREELEAITLGEEGGEAEAPAHSERGRTSPDRTKRTRGTADETTVGPLPGRGGPQHKYLQSLIKRLAESRGFRVTVEKSVLDGHGHVDVALEREGLTIACEVCVTTSVQHELHNLTKCLAAGFQYAVLVASVERTLQTARGLWGNTDEERIRFLVPNGLIGFLDDMARPDEPSEEPQQGGVAVANTKKPSRAEGGGPNTTGKRGDLLETQATKKRLVISRDAALYVGLAQQTLAKLRVIGGSPPYYKIGRQVLYDRADLDAWLAVRRRNSTSHLPVVY
jgi:hypothetical protein